MCAVYDSVVKDFQCNLINFVNSIENMAISTKNIAQIMNHVDPTTSINRSYLALLDWSQNLFILAERFEADFKTCIDKDISQPECSIRMMMGNIYEKYLFFLNHMAHSFIDIDEQSPLSASDCQSSASGPSPNTQTAIQRFRLQQSYMSSYRRWSEANAMDTNNTNNESNFDINRRWSMPTSTNVNKNRMNVIPKLAGLVGNTTQSTSQQQQLSQSSNNDSSEEWAAIQLLSFKPPLLSRPVSQQHSNFQYQTRNAQQPQQSTRVAQRQSRGELNEILILPRPNDSLFLGRCQQIAENIRGESDEY